jgi:hypothetical protein
MVVNLVYSWMVVMDSIPSLGEELQGCQFGDERLTKRVKLIVEALSKRPNTSIPSAMVSRAEYEACYRFFDNDNVMPEKILQPHFEATYKRLENVNVALLVQDTTEIDLTRPKQQVQGAGPMDSESRRGAFYHPMLAFDTNGISLGIIGQQSWTRDVISEDSKAEKQKKRRETPIEQKESYRWIQGLEMAKSAAAQCPETTCVCMGDSESDIYELFVAHATCETPNLHLLVRGGQNRNTTENQDWADQVRKTAKIATQSINIRARTAKIAEGKSARSRSRDARTVELEVRKATIEVSRPVHASKQLPASITLNVVLCEETNPPEGEDPISWLLVTTLPIDTEEQTQEIIRYYCIRWQIEVFFRTLKSGCRIEYRRFESLDRVLNCLALFSIVAWRLMYLCHLGRDCPEIECEVFFDPSEWKSVYAILGEEIPAQGCPSLNEVVRAIARLGGFVDRPRNQPGTQTLWIGLQRAYDLSNGWNAFGPGSKKFLTA